MGDDTTKDERFKEKNASNGPVEERGCTDILCFIIFVVCCIGMLVVASIGWAEGKPWALTSVFDGSGKCCGNVCDRYPEMEKYKYLYVTIPHPDRVFYHTTCVEECPDSAFLKEYNELKCYQDTNNFNVTSCADNCDAKSVLYNYDTYQTVQEALGGTYDLKEEIRDQTCMYQTTVLLDRVCFPTGDFIKSLADGAQDFQKKLDKSVDTQALQSYVDSVTQTWPITLASVFIAMAIGFIYMFFIKVCAGVMVWLSILFYHVLLICLGVFCWEKSKTYQDADPARQEDADNQKVMAYFCWGCAGLSVIIICFCFNKIQLAIQVLKAAAQYVNDVKSALIVPPVFSLITALFWFVWIIGFVFVYSNGTVEKSKTTFFGKIKWDEGYDQLVWFYVFMGLWLNAFIQACCQFILVSCPSIWYFAQPDGENLHTPVLKSLWRCVRFHMGSLAFGSFLVAVIQLIRLILAYIDEQAKKTGWGDQQPMKCILKCMQCVAACFERFIKFINKNAYIEIAISGNNFCSSAREAMRILWANALRATIINGVGGIFIFIGQFIISLFCTVICYQILTNAESYKEHSPFFPCILIFIISYTIAVLFMSIYGCGIDAIFLCFCHDEENARAKGMALPEHCPEALNEFFSKNEHKYQDKNEKVQKVEN